MLRGVSLAVQSMLRSKGSGKGVKQALEAGSELLQKGRLRSSVSRYGEVGMGFGGYVPLALKTPHPAGIGTI